MKRFAPVGLIMIFAIGGVVLASEEALKELEGSYKLQALAKDGKALPDLDKFKDKAKLQIKGDLMTFDKGDGEQKTAKIKLDPSKDPHTIDISPEDGPEKGKTFLGIYKLEKGEFTLLFVESGSKRPKDFTDVKDAALLKFKKD